MASTIMIDKMLDGRYQITHVLATGGFGQTYLAMDTRRPGQPVCVVKQLKSIAKPELVPTVQRLFRTEAAILEKLGQHESIPRLLAYFEEDQEFYLVQEFIPGQALDKELLPKEPFAIAQVIRLLTDILEILAFVHAQGVIHRDIKPANIMRRQPDQKLFLIDFGTVKEIRTVTDADEPKLTMAVGTPAYMPIEQFHGYPQFNSDIYALGIVGIQAISGLPIDKIRTLITSNHPQSNLAQANPAQTNPAQTNLNHWSGSLSSLDTGASSKQRSQLIAVLDKMVALNYRERYQSAASVMNDLEAITSDLSMPTSASNSVSSLSRAPSYISPLSSEIPSQLPASPLPPAAPAAAPATEVNATELKPRQLGRKLLVGTSLAIALITGAYKFSPLTSQPLSPSALPTVQPESSPVSPLKLARTLSGHTDMVWSVALSPDRKTLASGSQDDTIKIWDFATGKLRSTINAQADSVRSVIISADGETLVAGSGDGTIKAWDLSTGALRYTLAGHVSSVWSVALSSDGKTLVSGSEDNSIKVWNTETGTLTRTLTGHAGAVYSVALSPYGKTIASASADRTIKVWDIQTGQLLRTLEGHGDAVRSLAISPNGQTLASASWDRAIKTWNLQSGELLKTLEGHRDRVVSVAFSPDGQTLSSASLDKTIKIWNSQTGTTLQTLSGHTDWVLSVETSMRNQALISSSKDKTIRIWQP